MTIRRLSIQEAKAVYDSYLVHDFPRKERKPFSTIERAMRKDQYICFAAYVPIEPAAETENICAYAFLVVNGKNCLFDYLAVRADLRDRGYGITFLRELADEEVLRNLSCVLLEIENPRLANGASRDICCRREQFYLRNGLVDTGVESNTFGVAFRILELPINGTHSMEDVRRIYGELYRSFLPGFLCKAMVRISKQNK